MRGVHWGGLTRVSRQEVPLMTGFFVFAIFIAHLRLTFSLIYSILWTELFNWR